MAITELGKRPGIWCHHCAPGKGCAIYDDRPTSCRDFACLWLSQQSVPLECRPDRTKIVLTLEANNTRIIAHCDPADPFSWRKPAIGRYLRHCASAGWHRNGWVLAKMGQSFWLITPDDEHEIGLIDEALPYRLDFDAANRVTLSVLNENPASEPVHMHRTIY